MYLIEFPRGGRNATICFRVDFVSWISDRLASGEAEDAHLIHRINNLFRRRTLAEVLFLGQPLGMFESLQNLIKSWAEKTFFSVSQTLFKYHLHKTEKKPLSDLTFSQKPPHATPSNSSQKERRKKCDYKFKSRTQHKLFDCSQCCYQQVYSVSGGEKN